MGLAATDESGRFARPVGRILRSSDRQAVGEVAGRAKELGVALIVMGLPLHMGGQEGEEAARARRIAAKLGKASGIEVVLRDERLTSHEAYQRLRAQGVHGERAEERIDEVAAAVLLEDYLAERSGSPGPKG